MARSSLLHKILGGNVGGGGLFLLMISLAHDPAGGKPDAVLHALVLTGIVITVSLTAFALALAAGLPVAAGLAVPESPMRAAAEEGTGTSEADRRPAEGQSSAAGADHAPQSANRPFRACSPGDDS